MKLRVQHTKHQPRGFTLIELMFAMTAFCIMLVVAVSGFLNAMWIYSQASVSRDNQQQVRTIVDQIGRNVRAASRAYKTSDGSLCLQGTPEGNIRYYQDSNAHLLSIQVVDCGVGWDSTTQLTNSASLTYPAGASAKDLMSGGASVTVSIFRVDLYGQAAVAVPPPKPSPSPVSQSVRVELGVMRGVKADVVANARTRQFSNEFIMHSLYTVRGTLQ